LALTRQTKQAQNFFRGGLAPDGLKVFNHVPACDAYSRQGDPCWNRTGEQAEDDGLRRGDALLIGLLRRDAADGAVLGNVYRCSLAQIDVIGSGTVYYGFRRNLRSSFMLQCPQNI
jgi:hypothetical protein